MTWREPHPWPADRGAHFHRQLGELPPDRRGVHPSWYPTAETIARIIQGCSSVLLALLALRKKAAGR